MIENSQIEHELMNAISKVVPKKFRKTPIRPELSLAYDLGIDSISILSLIQIIEEKFGAGAVNCARQQWLEIHTVADFIRIFGNILNRE